MGLTISPVKFPGHWLCTTSLSFRTRGRCWAVRWLKFIELGLVHPVVGVFRRRDLSRIKPVAGRNRGLTVILFKVSLTYSEWGRDLAALL